MANLGKAYVQIIPKAEGITGKLQSVISPGSKKAGAVAGSDIIGGIKKALTATAIGAPIIAGFKRALDEGGKLQQSFGGLETLYGDAAEAAKQYAREAAAAGISANDYAEQAVSFGAALKSAFEGDTVKAAEAANTAILDMADNAAKMGTPLENIQNAYQGFAKQNYTMLDNLKLGYGGTKKEMQRLLEDATKLSGVEYDMENLGDVYSAIHVIQQELGLTGVAASEAEGTFTGSMGAMKAAASNLFAGLAMGENVAPYMEQLAGNAVTFLTKNMLPMIGNVLKGIPSMFDGVWKAVFGYSIDGDMGSFMDGIIDLLYGMLPKMVTTGYDMLTKLKDGFMSALPVVGTAAVDIVSMIGETITENLPTILEKGGEMFFYLVNGMVSKIPEFAAYAGEMIQGLATFISENLPVIGEKGKEFLEALGENMTQNIPIVLSALAKLTATIITTLVKLVPTIAKAGYNLISGLANGLGGTALSLVKLAMAKIKSAMEEPIEKAKSTISGVLDKIKGFFPIRLGKIFSGLELPHFKISGGVVPWGVGGLGTPPHVDVEWYAKAMNQPYMFNRASLIGVGEKGDEMLYGRNSLMRDIREAAGGKNITLNITVSGAENPEEWANRFAKEFLLVARTA